MKRLAIALIATIAITSISLFGCGASENSQQGSEQSQSETQEQSSEQPEDTQASQDAEQASEWESKQDVPVIEVAGCHLAPEKLIMCTAASSDNPEQGDFCVLVLRMEENKIPVTVSPFGTASGFEIMLENESEDGAPKAYPWFVRFEQMDGTEGTETRVLFYYKLRPEDSPTLTSEYYQGTEGKLPDNLYYQETGASNYGTYPLGGLSDKVALEEGGAEWPDAATELTGLSEGAQSVPLEGELVLYPDSSMLFESADAWAAGLFDDCWQKLVDDGVIAAPEEGAPNEYFTFGSVSLEVEYLDTEAGERLSSDLQIDLDDVVFYNPDNGIYYKTDVESLKDYPLFYPVVFGANHTSPKWDEPADLAEEQIAKFADSLDGCRYVVAYLGLDSRIDEDFYDMPKTDRVLKTTLAVVMDAQTREFVHIHEVGTDCPSTVTTESVGQVMDQKAIDYMFSLL